MSGRCGRCPSGFRAMPAMRCSCVRPAAARLAAVDALPGFASPQGGASPSSGSRLRGGGGLALLHLCLCLWPQPLCTCCWRALLAATGWTCSLPVSEGLRNPAQRPRGTVQKRSVHVGLKVWPACMSRLSMCQSGVQPTTHHPGPGTCHPCLPCTLVTPPQANPTP